MFIHAYSSSTRLTPVQNILVLIPPSRHWVILKYLGDGHHRMLLICEDDHFVVSTSPLGVYKNLGREQVQLSCCERNSTLSNPNVLAEARFERPTDCYSLLEVSPPREMQ